MTTAQKESIRDKLTAALIASLVTSLVPIAFALLSGLVTAPRRLADLEVVLRKRSDQDSLQTAALQRLDANIGLLTLMRCMEREGNPELYARLHCASLPIGGRR